MANLNIPFVLLQSQLCKFRPSIATSKLIAYQKYNLTSSETSDSSMDQLPNKGRDQNNASNNRNSREDRKDLDNKDAKLFNYGNNDNNVDTAGFSQFDDKPKNLMVLADSESGAIVLCHQEYYASKKKDQAPLKTSSVNKFIIDIQPRVILIPSIFEEVGPIRDYCLIRSPAMHVLSTSSHFLATLHSDNRLRLWNTNDGRCAMTSPNGLITTTVKRIKKIKTHPGHVIVVGEKGDIYIVNVYTMNLVKHDTSAKFEGVAYCIYKNNAFVLSDLNGKIVVWRDDSGPSIVPNLAQSLASESLLLELCGTDQQEIIKYTLIQTMYDTSKNQEDNQAQKHVLTLHYSNPDQILQVYSEGIDFYYQGQRIIFHQFNEASKKLIYAKFFHSSGDRRFLICIDFSLQVYIYDTLKLKNETTSKEPIFQLNLFEDCRCFEPNLGKQENQQSDLVNDDLPTRQQKYYAKVRKQIQDMCSTNSNHEAPFSFNPSERLLCTIAYFDDQPTIITWCFTTIIDNLSFSFNYKQTTIPLFTNSVMLYPAHIKNCLININPLLVRNYYNKHQYQFFFSDEQVVESIVYSSTENPSLIIGTNMGRIFIVPMFQEQEDQIAPINYIDAHHQTPITQLFLVYNNVIINSSQSNGKENSQQRSQILGHASNQKKNISIQGHLISISEDGTICVTNLNKSINEPKPKSKPLNKMQQNRADQFMVEKNRNVAIRRRNSLQLHFSFNNYFKMNRIIPQTIFNYQSFSPITKILQVQIINIIQERVMIQRVQENVRVEDDKTLGGRSSTFNLPQFGGNQPTQQESELSQYACLSDDGTVNVLLIPTAGEVTLTTYSSISSQVIGVYQDRHYLIALTDKLNIFMLNLSSKTLERKGDFKLALMVLHIEETVEYLRRMNDVFKLQSTKKDNKIIDQGLTFKNFDKYFKRKNLLVGLGSHKVLDYLSISLDQPLNYHPQNIYNQKYSKLLHDLLKHISHFQTLKNDEESQKIVLRAINDSFFYNNKLYKSDFNREQFENQSGVTTFSTSDTFNGSKQQLVIVDTKQVINVIRSKLIKGTNIQIQGMKKKTQNDGDFIVTQGKTNPMARTNPRQSVFKRESTMTVRQNMDEVDASVESVLMETKWPTRLISLVHPFNLDEMVDQQLEQQFGLNLPFLDFRIGVQGTEESFSFVISKEDEHQLERQNLSKVMRLLKLSKAIKEDSKNNERFEGKLLASRAQVYEDSVSDMHTEDMIQMQIEPLGRFFNSEYWKISSYMSTIMPSFFLSLFVSIVEFQQEDFKYLITELLYILQRINQQKTINNANQLSLSVTSKIILHKNHYTSSTARDVMMKPILYSLDIDYLQDLMEEWQSLIIDTYKRLKKQSNNAAGQQKRTTGSHTQLQQQQYQARNGSVTSAQSYQGEGSDIKNQQYQQIAAQSEHSLINSQFGQIEIRGLINLSQFAWYYSNQMDYIKQQRISKLTTLLTREMVENFMKNQKKYIHLLTILIQQLSTWIKVNQAPKKDDREIMRETIHLLLSLFNYYKQPLNQETFIIRVNTENFHLVRPTQSELYLKLTAAKTLIEIGENQTNDFLILMQEQTMNLNDGLEYQKNSLEILGLFINSQGENLENKLIQLTSILLKCLQPSDIALRKNSHQVVQYILSIMVKIFPMVAFHTDSQRLAVGTYEGVIAIYDLRTSAKWKILEKHEGNVTCLAFDAKGNLLASYSAYDSTVKLWKVGNTGFFSTIMGGSGKHYKEVVLTPLPASLNPHIILQQNKENQQYLHRGTIASQQEVSSQQQPSQQQRPSGYSGLNKVNKCSIKFSTEAEKKVVLVREDGSKNHLVFPK